jgi:hypothetical protein
MTMPRKSTRTIDFSEIPEASAEQFGALRRPAMRRGTPPSSASVPAESADGQSLRSDEAGPSERETREGIQRGLANAKAGRTTPAQRVFDELRRKHGISQHDEMRQGLRTDVQAGFDQLARGEAQSFDKVSGRQLTKRIKTRGRAATAQSGPSDAFEIVKAVGLALPDVEATTNWAGAPVLKMPGTSVAGIESDRSVEQGTLVVRCGLDDRERFRLHNSFSARRRNSSGMDRSCRDAEP